MMLRVGGQSLFVANELRLEGRPTGREGGREGRCVAGTFPTGSEVAVVAGVADDNWTGAVVDDVVCLRGET
jgi:hypothetical protein